MTRFICLLAGITLCIYGTSYGQVSQPYAAEWKKIDSLFDRGLPQSATKIAESVYLKAKEKGQQVQMLKAQMYLLTSDMQTKEDGITEAIKRAEVEAQNTGFPNNAVWQSIAAQLYWSYATIGALYLASLFRPDELKKVNIDSYDPVLNKGVNTRNLRPILYDLLAFRALAFFENDEKDVTQPAFKFEIDDPAAFSEANSFINHPFKTQDTLSLQWQALKVYQQLLSLHSSDAIPDAFIDADLHR
ncbi:MAG: alpha-2-macroglobulin domain protein, partial [Flavipsychrobacter sp.]|nr:alpha-2-macroglobulin domain protein [Flavipsychrobacter sp.]